MVCHVDGDTTTSARAAQSKVISLKIISKEVTLKTIIKKKVTTEKTAARNCFCPEKSQRERSTW